MALLTRPRDRARHAAPTSWRQKLFGSRNVVFDVADRSDTERDDEESGAGDSALTQHQPAAVAPTSEDHTRAVIARLVTGTNLYALDWRYGDDHATADVDPGLVPDSARDVLTAYATALGSMVLQEDVGDRTYLWASRAVDGVVVTVRADVTPVPVQPPQPAPAASPAPPQEQQLPIERLAHCALDDTQVFDAITDDTPAPGSEPEPGADGSNEDDAADQQEEVTPDGEETTEPDDGAHQDAA